MKNFKIYILLGLVVLAAGGGLWALSSHAETQGIGVTQENSDQAWFVRCNEPPEGEEPGPKRGRCEAFQRLTMQETGQRFAELAIGFPPEAESAHGVFILPLGILLPPGGVLTIDDNPPLNFAVRYCDNNGCVAHLSLNEDVLNMLRGGTTATLSLRLNNGQGVNIPMPLKGISKALDEVS